MAEALERAGYRTIRWLCLVCATCEACGEVVGVGEGACRTGFFPAIHTKCLGTPTGRAAYERLRNAIHGLPLPPKN